MRETEVLVIGGGIAGLTAASLLAKDKVAVELWEKNWIPGGCSTSYPRKHYVFESGATTLVGLDDEMPLKFLLDKIGLELPALKLEKPMQVYLPDGKLVSRYPDLEGWISEAERVFGSHNQRAFWTHCYAIAQAVWRISLQQLHFPPSRLTDLWQMLKQLSVEQLRFAPYAFISVSKYLERYGLAQNTLFKAFVDEQLMITAQNKMEEVNMLFGATALCYTLFGNYYLNGGFINLAQPLSDYIEAQGGTVKLRTGVERVEKSRQGYVVQTKTESVLAKSVIFAIPINNVLELWQDDSLRRRFTPKLLGSPQLHSAFTMGIVAKRLQNFDCLHHQIHLANPLPHCGSHSIFVSLSHHQDPLRCKAEEIVMNVSTHLSNPAQHFIDNKSEVESAIIEILAQKGFLKPDEIVYVHSSTPHAWEKWTSRKWGFVGGYPQYLRIKPWQMLGARLDHEAAYLCGDSAYPGQGIPGATLSGIIAYKKWKADLR